MPQYKLNILFYFLSTSLILHFQYSLFFLEMSVGSKSCISSTALVWLESSDHCNLTYFILSTIFYKSSFRHGSCCFTFQVLESLVQTGQCAEFYTVRAEDIYFVLIEQFSFTSTFMTLEWPLPFGLPNKIVRVFSIYCTRYGTFALHIFLDLFIR
jgi:hypothetical protein